MTSAEPGQHRTVLYWPLTDVATLGRGTEASMYEIAHELYRRGDCAAAAHALARAVSASCQVMRETGRRPAVLEPALDAMTFLLLVEMSGLLGTGAVRSAVQRAARIARATRVPVLPGNGDDLLSTAHALLAESVTTEPTAPARSWAATWAAYDLIRAAEIIEGRDHPESILGALYHLASLESRRERWSRTRDALRALDAVRDQMPWRQCHTIIAEVALIGAMEARQRGRLAQALNRASEAVGHARLASRLRPQLGALVSRSLEVLSDILEQLGRYVEAAEASLEAAMYRVAGSDRPLPPGPNGR